MAVLFISDLHLCDERPDKIASFQRLLDSAAKNADYLYILGDLFEAWAGDDDHTSPHPEIIAALSGFTHAGGRLSIMRGNRDYLLGKEFARVTGAHLLADETTITIGNRKILLMHGDTLCTRDVKYQAFRCLVNNPVAIRVFLLCPFPIRKFIWHGIRDLTRKTTARKAPYVIDVHQNTVEQSLRKHGVRELIHGHTHRPGIHDFTLDRSPARRYVLGDWYEEDSILVADNNEMRMMRVREYLRRET